MPQGVASLALGYVLHWAFSPPLLNPKLEFLFIAEVPPRWRGMVNPTLQLVLHGHNIGHSQVTLSTTDVSIDSIVRPVNSSTWKSILQIT
ncbi:MAG: cyclomaltodextrinase N-terminal domain-containing protein, partial [Bacteroidales bacterium]